jgi:hypothetical protein
LLNCFVILHVATKTDEGVVDDNDDDDDDDSDSD